MLSRALLISGLIFLCGSVFGQKNTLSDVISVNFSNLSFHEALKILVVDSGLNISYSDEILPDDLVVKIQKTGTLEEILKDLLAGTGINYKIIGEQVVLIKDKPHVKNIEFALNGYVEDALTGENLPGAIVMIKDSGTGTVSNNYGFYSLSLPQGDYEIVCSYLGYQQQQQHNIALTSDVALKIELVNQAQQLDELVVTGNREAASIDKVIMSTEKLVAAQIARMPALMGESDVIRSLLLLPGVQSVGEGKTGLFVRGSRADQTLIQLDEANIFNAFHMGGLFSVFNPDAIRDVKLYKGAIPANYGGRSSSVLDIRMKDGQKNRVTATGGLGTISSRLTLEGPLVSSKKKNKSNMGSFMISGRRTYLDLLLGLSGDEEINNNTLFFYDLNAKLNYTINENNRVYLSAYKGRDVFRFEDEIGLGWGNLTTTLRWNHLFNKKLFLNTTFLYSNFDYGFLLADNSGGFDWSASLKNYSIKGDFYHYVSPAMELDYGYSLIWHHFSPAKINPLKQDDAVLPLRLSTENALEQGVYMTFKNELTSKLTVDVGLRISLFFNIGPGDFLIYESGKPKLKEHITDTIDAGNFELVNSEFGIEPRFNLSYLLNPETTLKASYNRNKQYLHVLTTNNIGFPTDRYKPTDPNLRPQTSDQWSLGIGRSIGTAWQLSLEAYYRRVDNLAEIDNEPNSIISTTIEQHVTIGKGWAYGAELSLRKSTGRITGWLAYTWTSTWEKVPGLNGGRKFHPYYDRAHDLNLSVNYELNSRISLSTNWVYSSGQAISLPVGKYQINGKTLPRFNDLNLNGDRGPAYHRLDLSINIKGKNRKKHRWRGSWNIGFYNVYFRRNSIGFQYRDIINGDPNISETDKGLVVKSREFKAVNTYLFQFVPSITYNFKF